MRGRSRTSTDTASNGTGHHGAHATADSGPCRAHDNRQRVQLGDRPPRRGDVDDHVDDGPAAKPGTETYYQHASTSSKRLAGLLYEDVERTFAGRPGIAWFANVDAGAKYRMGESGDDYYGILRLAHGVPTAISEGLFLSASRAEADLLARPD